MKTCQHTAGHDRCDLPYLAERLRRDARKFTGPRAAILEALRRQAHPVTTREILSSLADQPCDRATIYRSLHLLEKMNLVRRVHFNDGAARFELVREDDGGHHHHLVCTSCSRVVAIHECFSAEIEKRIAGENGFKAVTHKLEFFGVCPECQK